MKKNHLIFKTDQIQAIEKKIFSAGIFSPQRLMELAAKSVIENLILTFGKPSALSIFCGRGTMVQTDICVQLFLMKWVFQQLLLRLKMTEIWLSMRVWQEIMQKE